MRSLIKMLSILSFASASHAAEPEISLVGVSSGTIQDAVKMLAGEGSWKAEAAAQFVKLDLRFAASPQFNRVEVQSCGQPFNDGANLFVNFDDSSLFCEGGKNVLTFNFSKAIENARSITLNLRYNKSVCISAVRFLKDGKIAKISVPFIHDPLSVSVPALSDGRLDTTWALDETDKAAELKFETEQKIDKIRVWNGDQRSSGKFKAVPRVKSLALFTDKQREVVSLKDSPEPQTIELENTVKGKVIRLLVEEAHGGTLAAARMSEVQVAYDDEFIVADITATGKEKSASVRSSFENAKLGEMLDRNLTSNEDDTKWSIRVRSDGTLFMRGHTENLQRSRDFSYLGHYKIDRADKKGVHISVEGFTTNLPAELDASTCGRDCGGNPGPEPVFIHDEISFGRGKNGIIFVRDEGPRRGKGLEFKTLKARIAKDSE